MYKISKDDEIIALQEKLRYIKLSKEGAFIQCGKDDALGIAVDGTFYRFDYKDVPGYDAVRIAEVEGGEYITEYGKSIESLTSDMSTTMVGLTESYETSLNNSDEINSALLALAEIYEEIISLESASESTNEETSEETTA